MDRHACTQHVGSGSRAGERTAGTRRRVHSLLTNVYSINIDVLNSRARAPASLRITTVFFSINIDG